MSNLFLKVNKDLFKLGLNPTELLILAQIMEFDTNNKTCYMTNEQFAKELNVSEKTVQRALNDTLEDKGYITIINPRSKNRSFQLNKSVIEDKLGQIDQDKEHGQNVQDNMDNLSNQHGQFDPIKDNKKINIKDKELVEPQARSREEAIRDVMSNSTNSEGKFNF